MATILWVEDQSHWIDRFRPVLEAAELDEQPTRVEIPQAGTASIPPSAFDIVSHLSCSRPIPWGGRPPRPVHRRCARALAGDPGYVSREGMVAEEGLEPPTQGL